MMASTTVTSSDADSGRVHLITSHEAAMRKAIADQVIYDPKNLNAEHWKFVDKATEDFGDEAKDDVTRLLHSHWCSIVEHKEDQLFHNIGEKHNSQLCMYLTSDWVYVLANTNRSGYVKINFGNQETRKSGFSAYGRRFNGKLVWGLEYDDLSQSGTFRSAESDRVFDLIFRAACDIQESRDTTTELFHGVKEFVDEQLKEHTSQILVIIPTSFAFQERAFLRQCCKAIGYEKVTILTDSSLAAYQFFDTSKSDTFSVLVVNLTENFVDRLEIYGRCDSNGAIGGVHLLAVAFGSCDLFLGTDELKNMYQRALEQTPEHLRNSLSSYVVLSDIEYVNNAIDEYFRDEEKMTKMSNILGDKVSELFSRFYKNADKLRKFIGLSANNSDKSVPEPEASTSSEDEMDIVTRDEYAGQAIRRADKLSVISTKGSSSFANLVGNCVAVQNGTEPENVDGIQPGCLILALTDPEKFTMGEVGSTCKIKGYGDTIFVGVKFRKQLSMGSTGIMIDHVGDGQGFCQSCKGAMSLFIPRDQIGSSKDHLFQVQ